MKMHLNAGILLGLLACPGALAAGTPELLAKGIRTSGQIVTNVERRILKDAVALRYVLPDGEKSVSDEDTIWTLPSDARIWYQAATWSDWDGTPAWHAHYEAPFSTSVVADLSPGARMSLPVVAQLADGTFAFFTEADVVDYTDSIVEYVGNGCFTPVYCAEANGVFATRAKTTPWRVLLTVKDLDALGTSGVVRDLCPEPTPEVAAKCRSFVKPGKCVWQWLPAGEPKYAEQQAWYDRTKALGFPYYLVDDGWKVWRDGELDQWACLQRWIDYGKSVGVESFVWADSKELRLADARRAYLDKVKAAGAVGVKIDFVPDPSRAVMAWYEETLADTLARGLMTDFHGCVKPSGREKTWPHEVAREAIRGHEWQVSRYRRSLAPEHDCILPFHRLVQGHADYTPVVFRKSEIGDFSWPRQLAQGVVFSAPFLCFGDDPQEYLDNPMIEIVRALEPVYDEMRYLPGSEIGACVVVAKRKGDTWFLAVENGAAARSLRIPLSLFLKGPAQMLAFRDDLTRNDAAVRESRSVTPEENLAVTMRPSGGFIAMFRPVARPVPRPALVERIRSGVEVYGIVHWGLNTYTDREWGYGDENPEDLAPDAFDAEQIVSACKDGGLQGLIVVAKHHDGFCLWPTKTTEHNISKSPFRGGKGDYVKEMELACRKYGLRFGVYCSPWDRNHADYASPKYVETFHAQIKELLSGDYGEIFEMWFDGANGGDGYYGGAKETRRIPLDYYRFDEVFRFVRELQPRVCIFNEDDGADYRWPGNESGQLADDSSATIRSWDPATYRTYCNRGDLEGGTTFHPPECDFPLRKGWFYHASETNTVRCGEYLMQRYLETVGNGGTMNLGIAPDRHGRLAPEDVAALKRFGELKREFFVRTGDEKGRCNVIVLAEDVSAGELVGGWKVTANGGTIASGSALGIKRIRVLPQPVAKTDISLEFAGLGEDGLPEGHVVRQRFHYVDPKTLNRVMNATTTNGETDTARWMTGAIPLRGN